MRTGERIGRTPTQHRDHERAVRERLLADLTVTLARARDEGAEWYSWIAGGCQPLTPDEYDRLRREGGQPRRRGRR